MTIIEKIDTLKQKISLRDWLLLELKKLEDKFGLSTNEFIDKWKKNTIPEPEDPDTLEDFLEWEGLFESLEKVEKELKEFEKRIKES